MTSFIQDISLKEWCDYKGKTCRTTGSLPVSVFHLNRMVDTGDSILTDSSLWHTQDILTMMLWGLFGAYANEKVPLGREEYVEYANNALDRLSEGRDTGLVLPGALEAWGTLSTEEQILVREELCCKVSNLESFPDLGTINIVGTNVPAVIDYESVHLPSVIPVLAETSKGIVAIAPHGWGNNYSSESSLLHTLRSDILCPDKVHIWDLSQKKIKSANESSYQQSIEMIYSICD